MNVLRRIKQPRAKARPMSEKRTNVSEKTSEKRTTYLEERRRLREIIRKSPHKITESFLSYYHPGLLRAVKDFTKDEFLHEEDFDARMELFIQGHQTTPRCCLDGCDNFVMYRDGRFSDICDFHHEHRNVSSGEQELRDFLRVSEIDFGNNDEELIGMELDIVIPSCRIAIEYNGLHWHSENGRRDFRTNYRKWKACRDKGYELLTVWEDAWKDRKPEIQSLILQKAKERPNSCLEGFRMLRKREAVDLLAKEHKSPRERKSLFIGGLSQGELVACLTVRMDDCGNLEILDFTETGVYVHEKDMRKFVPWFLAQRKLRPQKVYGYTDCDGGNGTYMERMGFRKPSHVHDVTWIRNGKRISERILFHKLSELRDGEYRKHNCHRLYGTGMLYWETVHK